MYCVHVICMLKLILHFSIYCRPFKFSMLIPPSLKTNTGLGKNRNCLFRAFKSPRVTRGLIEFSSVSAVSDATAATAVLPILLNSPGKPLQRISLNHTWLTYGCGQIVWQPFRWPWVEVTKLPKRDVIYLLPTIKWELLIQSLEICEVYSPYHAFHLIKFWKFCQFFYRFFFVKF